MPIPNWPTGSWRSASGFLGTPYRLGPLGEASARISTGTPLFSFKEADCTTFIEQVMALSIKRRLPDALDALTAIRYQGGRVGYLTRNHFPEVDWIPNNKAAGFLEDITREIAGEKTGEAGKIISKRRWYDSKTIDDLAGFSGLAPKEKESRLKRLRAAGAGLRTRRPRCRTFRWIFSPRPWKKSPPGPSPIWSARTPPTSRSSFPTRFC